MFDFKEHSIISEKFAEKCNSQLFEKAKKKLILPSATQLSFLEFNAEIFAGKMNGDKYIEPIEKLFRKMNNIKMPDD